MGGGGELVRYDLPLGNAGSLRSLDLSYDLCQLTTNLLLVISRALDHLHLETLVDRSRLFRRASIQESTALLFGICEIITHLVDHSLDQSVHLRECLLLLAIARSAHQNLDCSRSCHESIRSCIDILAISCKETHQFRVEIEVGEHIDNGFLLLLEETRSLSELFYSSLDLIQHMHHLVVEIVDRSISNQSNGHITSIVSGRHICVLTSRGRTR
ncbi:hypothetical protein PMAYCL1PPCAC_28964 [Pristionchus mayeri]|uniref:Uncharacterized protein n=1 Tax=Pristionchus mayeri TaxID=1317129 RepID=A0AAN5IBN8_9BILA|nr:hypothetical protein PMAYCL1PPCAC_28964 [Pristionchus mayeri]